ncbi:AraC family transcriptional regulator [Pseudovibrio brasiliensis]|uniref:AraC family transcriptional regulator n=1 Tax=Pseudovibrio brasiliensis TaxID=1898042 RepID=A0ABX8ANI2_9HYPH|nr:helix-turn-helix domain-containing protein [Pseudovibrio brasiliensis]QUS55465.1 AraC family transcriptional regulator [Pseudovibrio brasiliensis]
MTGYYTIQEPCTELRPYIRGFHLADHQEQDIIINCPPTGYPLLGYIWRGISQVRVNNQPLNDISSRNVHFAGQLKRTHATVHWNGGMGHAVAEFTATGLHELFGINGIDLINKTQPVHELAENFANTLEDQLAAAVKPIGFVEIFQKCLLQQIQYKRSIPAYISKAVKNIESVNGVIKLNNLLEELDIEPRHFNRKFRQIVGLSPKYFCRIVQFNHVASIVLSDAQLPLAELAAEAGFFDQSHFTKACNEFVLSSPRVFLQSDYSRISTFLRQMSHESS